MKFLTLVLSLVLSFSISSAQATTSIEKLSASDRETVGRMVSTVLLERAAVNLNNFFASGNEQDLAPLLKAWLPADQLRIKRELQSLPEKPKLRVAGATLFIGLKSGEVAFEVVDPFDGIFLLDGKQIRIRPLAQYQQLGEKIDELFEVSYEPHPIMSLIMPQAHAGLGTALGKGAAIIAAKLSKPTAAAAGGYVRKEAASTAKSAGDSYFVRSSKELREVNNPALSTKLKNGAKNAAKATGKWVGVTIGTGMVAGTVFRCSAISSTEDIASLNCLEGIKRLPGQILCDREFKTEGCVSKASELSPAPKIASEGEAPVSGESTVLKPVNGNKCTETRDGTGLQKDVIVEQFEEKTVERAKKLDLSVSDVHPVTTQSVHLEYAKDEKDSKKLTYKAVVDSVRMQDPENPKKQILSKQSFWVYKDGGEKWDMYIFENPAVELKKLDDVRAKFLPRRVVQCDQSKLSKECEDEYVRVIGAVIKLKDCPPAKSNSGNTGASAQGKPALK